jgi:glyoxylase-like metal-dependent hydrolase (beta-lactamase superfamily II)
VEQVSAPIGSGVGVQPIAENVIRVPLPLPLPDLKEINAYVIVGADGLTLIDPGWAYPASESALRAVLDGLGAAPTDVRRILVTHQHWDHYSLGVKWRDEFHTELMLGREERHSIEAFRSLDGVHPRQVGMLRRAGALQLANAIDRLEWEPYERGVAFAPPDRWLDDGDEIDCAGAKIVVRATPGHTRGHVVFDDTTHGAVFTGDHLLPSITPSIAFERAPERLPLRSYLSSLLLLLWLPDKQMLPAHGSTDRHTRVRAEELLVHHHERLGVVSELVASGASTAWEVASKMVWTRRDRAIGDLDVVHQMVAVLEVLSHLDFLVAEGSMSSHESDGIAAFSLT